MGGCDEVLHGWLEADEAHRDRCIVSLAILASPIVPPLPTQATSSCAGVDDAETLAAAPSRPPLVPAPPPGKEPLCEPGRSVALFAAPATLLAAPLAATLASPLASPLASLLASQLAAPLAVPLATPPPQPSSVGAPGQDAWARSEMSLLHRRPGGGRAASGTAAAAEDELRRAARQFVRDAVTGLEGLTWIDAWTGEREPCYCLLLPQLAELVFIRGDKSPGRGCPSVLPMSPAKPDALASGSSTTASSASPPGSCGGKGVDNGCVLLHDASEAQYEPGELRRVRLSSLHSVWRPEERKAFPEAHQWYAAMTREERQCVLCLDHAPQLRPSRGANDADSLVATGTSAALGDAETICILERTQASRERFVACAKVLRLTMS